MSQVIDYTQYACWSKCPWLWIERYVRNLRRRRSGDYANDDTRTIGTLVHAGIEAWHRTKQIGIPESVVIEANPTADALRLCEYIVQQWVRTYEGDNWTVEALEEPLEKRLSADVVIMAKVDSVLRVHEQTALTDGWRHEKIVLEPGVWAQEYKTKDSKIDRNRWMARWQFDMQAVFQTIVGRERWPGEFRGVMVNVIEKPSQYVPRRKCKGCSTLYEYGSYLPAGDGEYNCPMCGLKQKLTALKDKPEFVGAEFYRFVQQPSERQIEQAQNEINKTALLMSSLKTGIVGSGNPLYELMIHMTMPNRLSCYDTIYGPCEFGQWHVNGDDVDVASPLIEIKDNSKYMRVEGKRDDTD